MTVGAFIRLFTHKRFLIDSKYQRSCSRKIYSAEANKLQHDCECCQETSSRQEQVELTCADGSTRKHTYIIIEACSCVTSKCVLRQPGR
uniref:CTCK domain-containing protein n=1 Tax=Myripristis murdjan TaxID=586833 RepID=A0A667X4C9_9TELE